MNKMLSIIFASLLLASSIFAQETVDSFLPDDSLSNQENVEILAEQSSDNENSSLLDVLQEQQSCRRGNIELRSRFIQQLQKSRGYQQQKYLGSPLMSYQRVKISCGQNLGVGMVLEKDAGEQRLNDFMAGYAGFQSLGPIASLIAGDYIVEAGQGLAMWRGDDVRKGGNAIIPAVRKGRDLVPYASSNENSFLRGCAMAISLKKTFLTFFFSNKSYAGTLDSAGDVRDINTSGYFRTEEESGKREAFHEQLIGGRCRYFFSDTNFIGITTYAARFSRVLDIDRIFFGDNLAVASIDYSFHALEFTLFGETARSTTGALACVSGLSLSPVAAFDLVFVYRNYPPNLFSLHGNGFGDRAGTCDEQGLYVGLQLRLLHGITINSYCDMFRSTCPSTNSYFPSSCTDVVIECKTSLKRRLHLTARCNSRVAGTGQNVADAEGRSIRVDDRSTRQGVRLDGEYRVSANVRVRCRMEYSDYSTDLSHKHETGRLLSQNLNLSPVKQVLLDFRIVFFNTDSYNAGISEFEEDLPGKLTVPILSGSGLRWYMLARYAFSEQLSLCLKYSNVIREDVKTIGSGPDELPTNHDNRIGVQLDVGL